MSTLAFGRAMSDAHLARQDAATPAAPAAPAATAASAARAASVVMAGSRSIAPPSPRLKPGA